MKNLLQRAVGSQEVPARLETRIRSAIRASELESERKAVSRWPWRRPSLPGLGFAFLAIAVFAFLSVGVLTEIEETYIAKVGRSVSTLMRVGLGDHIHCAVLRRFPKNPPPVEAMRNELGPDYAPLMAAVKANMPSEYTVQLAHKCRYQGREFVHLALKDNDRLLSVVVTTKKNGETFSADRLVPALVTSGIPFYRQEASQFQLSAFESSKHLVYLISDLPGDKNMRLLNAMAGELNAALPKT